VIATANTFVGGTLITDGALHLSAVGAVGSGAVAFDQFGGETLILDDAALTGGAFANDVVGLGDGDAVDVHRARLLRRHAGRLRHRHRAGEGDRQVRDLQLHAARPGCRRTWWR
jgi:hypothetical protein